MKTTLILEIFTNTTKFISMNILRIVNGLISCARDYETLVPILKLTVPEI
jgi:hypothetical protein